MGKMNREEARKALGLPQRYSTSDIEISYNHIASTCHPIVTKDPLKNAIYKESKDAYYTLRPERRTGLRASLDRMIQNTKEWFGPPEDPDYMPPDCPQATTVIKQILKYTTVGCLTGAALGAGIAYYEAQAALQEAAYHKNVIFGALSGSVLGAYAQMATTAIKIYNSNFKDVDDFFD